MSTTNTKLNELEVLKFELENLKPERLVYEQRGCSTVLFKTDRGKALHQVTKELAKEKKKAEGSSSN